MSSGIRPSLLEKAKSLDHESAEVNTLIEDREKALNEIGLGVEAEIDLFSETGTYIDPNSGSETGRPAEVVTRFGFGNKTGRWGFFAQRAKWLDGDGRMVEQEEPIGLRNAPQKVRIEAMARFDELQDALEQAADELLKKSSKETNT